MNIKPKGWNHNIDTNLEHGSQPLRPTTMLRLTGYTLPLLNFPCTKQVAEYKAIAAPMLKPPIPSLISDGSVDKRFAIYAAEASIPSTSSGPSSESSLTSNQAVQGNPPKKATGPDGAVGQIHFIF